ncbi:hypothetical protein ACFWM3_19215 [Gottfriedia sp. NPDC058432]|uniref:hypothetical protein n=1 Tax=Gottfriedia sp. NPDC058432 TaxID=3346497 RepID=UPI003662044B
MKKMIGLTSVVVSFSLLTGCGQTNNSAPTNVESTTTSKMTKEAETAKSELTSKIMKLRKTNTAIEKDPGYFEPNDFRAFKNELNPIMYALKLKSKLDVNDSEEINSVLTKVEKKVNDLTGDEALNAQKRLHTGKAIYKTLMQESLDRSFKVLNVTNSIDNELAFFIDHTAKENANNLAKLGEEADSVINDLNSEKTYIDEVRKATKDNVSLFSDKELKLLNSTCDNLTSSVNNQIKVLEQFKPVYVDNGISPNEYLVNATTDYDNAKKSFLKIEGIFAF